MSIPVYINQESAGTLTVSQDGLYTVLEVETENHAGLVRLWAHGGGKSAYLGLMQPWKGGLWLRRRLSRSALSAFPDPIEFVSDREQDRTGEVQEENKEDLHNNVDINTNQAAAAPMEKQDQRPEEPPTEEVRPEKAQPQESAPQTAESLHNKESGYKTCPWPAEPPEEGLLWYSRGDGTLTAFDGISKLLAIPAALRAPSAQAVERVIEGKKYLVFRY